MSRSKLRRSQAAKVKAGQRVTSTTPRDRPMWVGAVYHRPPGGRFSKGLVWRRAAWAGSSGTNVGGQDWHPLDRASFAWRTVVLTHERRSKNRCRSRWWRRSSPRLPMSEKFTNDDPRLRSEKIDH